MKISRNNEIIWFTASFQMSMLRKNTSRVFYAGEFALRTAFTSAICHSPGLLLFLEGRGNHALSRFPRTTCHSISFSLASETRHLIILNDCVFELILDVEFFSIKIICNLIRGHISPGDPSLSSI